jgi:protein TonB
LKRTKYVAPKYPRAAQRRNLSGWVDVVFTVTTDGSVKDVEIRNSEPGETFVNAATKAVQKWEFEPVIENGTIVEKLVGVRMMFALE